MWRNRDVQRTDPRCKHTTDFLWPNVMTRSSCVTCTWFENMYFLFKIIFIHHVKACDGGWRRERAEPQQRRHTHSYMILWELGPKPRWTLFTWVSCLSWWVSIMHFNADWHKCVLLYTMTLHLHTECKRFTNRNKFTINKIWFDWQCLSLLIFYRNMILPISEIT